MTVHVDTTLDTITLEQWRALPEDARYELVDGVLLMSPNELSDNRRAVGRIGGRLFATSPALDAMQEMSVMVARSPRLTIRVPDLVIVPADAAHGVREVDPADVLAVVEVLSPSSQEADWVHKRREYAMAGIPTYLVVDLKGGRLTLFTAPVDGRYTEVAAGDVVTLDLAGTPMDVALADLI